MPICIECGETRADVTRVENGVRVLAVCGACGEPCDTYAEMDGVQTSIALMLLHKRAYRHTLFNTPHLLRPLIILVLLSCTLEAYVGVVQNSYLSFYREHHHLLFSPPAGPSAAAVGQLADSSGSVLRASASGLGFATSSASSLSSGARASSSSTSGAVGGSSLESDTPSCTPATVATSTSTLSAAAAVGKRCVVSDGIRRAQQQLNVGATGAVGAEVADGAASASAVGAAGSTASTGGGLLKQTLKNTALKMLLAGGDATPSSTATTGVPSFVTSASIGTADTDATGSGSGEGGSAAAALAAEIGAMGHSSSSGDAAEESVSSTPDDATVVGTSVVDDDTEEVMLESNKEAIRLAAEAEELVANRTLFFVQRFITRGPSLQLVEVVRQYQALKIVPFFTTMPKMLLLSLLEFAFLLAVVCWVGAALINCPDYPSILGAPSGPTSSTSQAVVAEQPQSPPAAGDASAVAAAGSSNNTNTNKRQFPKARRTLQMYASVRSPSAQSGKKSNNVCGGGAYHPPEILRVLLRVLAISTVSKMGYLLFLVWDMPLYLVCLVEGYQFAILLAALRGAKGSFNSALAASFVVLCAKYFFRLLMKALPPFLASVSFQIMLLRS